MTKRDREKLMRSLKSTANSANGNNPEPVTDVNIIETEFSNTEQAYIPKGSKRGAMDKYDELRILDRLDDIEEMYREGYSDNEVATRLGISVRTLYNWLNRGIGGDDSINANFGRTLGEPVEPAPEPEMEKYIPFIEARKRGRAPSNERLEKTAYAVALGDYEQEEVSIGWDEGVAREHRYKKRLAPNSQMIWRLMLNRMPEKYRDKVEVAHTGSMDTTLRLLGNVPPDQLAELKSLAKSAVSAQFAQQVRPEDEDVETPIDSGDEND